MAPSDFSVYNADMGNHELLNLKYPDKKVLVKGILSIPARKYCVGKDVLLLVASMTQEFRPQELSLTV